MIQEKCNDNSCTELAALICTKYFPSEEVDIEENPNGANGHGGDEEGIGFIENDHEEDGQFGDEEHAELNLQNYQSVVQDCDL